MTVIDPDFGTFSDFQVSEYRKIRAFVEHQFPLAENREFAQCHVAVTSLVCHEHEVTNMIPGETLLEEPRHIIFPRQIDFLKAHDVGIVLHDEPHDRVGACRPAAFFLELLGAPQGEVPHVVSQYLDCL